MPRKVRELVKDLMDEGFVEIQGAEKGSHRKYTHARFSGAVTISGKLGDDSKLNQEKQVKQAIEEVSK